MASKCFPDERANDCAGGSTTAVLIGRVHEGAGLQPDCRTNLREMMMMMKEKEKRHIQTKSKQKKRERKRYRGKKWSVHPKMNENVSFSLSHVVPNPWRPISATE